MNYMQMSKISAHQALSLVKKMRPDLLIILDRSKMFVVEFTIGFKPNIAKNEVCKRNKYKNLTQSLKSKYDQVKYLF